jgi:fermentation-respiration switch protein FrsA (DUF1100 family)
MQTNTGRRRFPVLASVLAGAAGGLLGTAYYVTLRVNPPQRRKTFIDHYTFTPWELGVPYETLRLRTRDDLGLSAWWMPRSESRRVLIACHGHTGRKDDMLGIGTSAWRAGYNVLVFDFRGRGDSDPWPNSLISREADDLLAAVGYVSERIADAQIAVVGFSMGAAVTIMAAAQEPRIAAVVADSSFTAVRDVVANGLRKRWRLPAEPFISVADELLKRRHGYRFKAVRPIDHVAAIAPRPLLIIHGSHDKLIPVSHGRALYAQAGEPKELWICDGVEHCGTYFCDRAAYVDRVIGFLNRHFEA